MRGARASNGALPSRRERGRRPNSPGPVDPSHVELWTGFLLHRVASSAHHIYSQQTRRLDLRPFHVGILQLLHGSGPMIQGKIAESLGVDKPTMVALIGEMEKGELVTRMRHPDDGRASIIHLSARGAAQLQLLDEINQQCTDVLLAALSPDERNVLHGLLMKIHRSHC